VCWPVEPNGRGMAAARLIARRGRSRSPNRDKWERNGVGGHCREHGTIGYVTPALVRDRRLRATRDGRAFGRSRGARGCVKDRARRPQTEERPWRSIGLCRGATRALTQGPRPEPRPSVATRPGSRCDLGQSQLGSGIGTNAKNLRGRSRDIRDRMSDTGRPRQSARLLAHAATQEIKPHATSTTNHRLS
jgi:hypothetical protein